MDPSTIRTLSEINRRFYRSAAVAFSETRRDPWPGWERVLEACPTPGRILDVGCGNGRFARWLASRGTRPELVGVDWSPELLAQARGEALGEGTRHWVCADVTATGWDAQLPQGRFELITLFGLLHHVPGRERRIELLRTLARRLAPGGLLALALWQFGRHDRFRRRLLSWNDYNKSAADPVDPSDLEPGDALLPFGPVRAGSAQDVGASPPRYCHFVDEKETEELVASLQLPLRATFLADGRSGDLNRYLLLGGPPA